MDRDNASATTAGQAKTALKGAGVRALTLEVHVAQFLAASKKDKSLGHLARKLSIPRQSLTRYLNAEQSMTLSTLQKIAAAMGVTTEDILSFRESD